MKKIVSFASSLVMLFSCVSCSHSENISNSDNIRNNDPMEISIYCLGPDVKGISDYSGNETIHRIEEKYNVKFSMVHPIWEKEDEALEHIFESGHYCDIMYIGSSEGYQGGDEVAVSDGVFWDLTDYVKEYMPNYNQLIHSNPDLLRFAYNDSGKIIGLSVFPFDAQNQRVAPSAAVAGLIIRKDWLDESGLELPETYDDWEKVLTVFKEKYGCDQPYYIAGDGFCSRSPGFCGGFGAIPSMQMNEDIVEYGPMTERWRSYVTLMHDWYEKGLIGSEYITNNTIGIDVNQCISEETGAMLCVNTMVDGIEEAISDPEADFCAVQFPVLNKGDVCQAGDPLRSMSLKKIYVTTEVSKEKLPEILGILDDMYSFDYAFELAYGSEGDTWVKDDQGDIVFTDKIMHSKQGFAPDKALEAFLMPGNMMLLKDWSREITMMSEEKRQMCEIWDMDGMELYVPALQLTSEEKEMYDSIMVDAEAYMKDMTNKMIVGAVDIDAGWDAYVQTLENMGIRDAITAYQNAYNRYMHR